MASDNRENEQWLRKVGLIVSTGTKGLDLSNLRIRFQVFAPDEGAPPTAIIRVFNLSATTAKTVQKEFQTVTLQAGYERGNYGIIFQGTIKQFRRGRENQTDTYLDIMAADGDYMSNFVHLDRTLAGGAEVQARYDAIKQQIAQQTDAQFQNNAGGAGDPSGAIPPQYNTFGGVLPRGKVMWGLPRAQLDILANTTNTSWNIQNGKINIKLVTGYLPGEAVILNSANGMIGIPEATNNGIEVTCLINPLLRVGGRVHIDNASINTVNVREQTGFPTTASIARFADVTNDGFYRIIVIEHRGDSWGNEWYSSLVCLSIDPSAAPNNSVKSDG